MSSPSLHSWVDESIHTAGGPLAEGIYLLAATVADPAACERNDCTNWTASASNDIARHTASVLSSMLLNRIDAAEDPGDEAELACWEACERLVAQQLKALDPDNRLGMIAQNEVWELEKAALLAEESAGVMVGARA